MALLSSVVAFLTIMIFYITIFYLVGSKRKQQYQILESQIQNKDDFLIIKTQQLGIQTSSINKIIEEDENEHEVAINQQEEDHQFLS